jgi:hypothetical protein
LRETQRQLWYHTNTRYRFGQTITLELPTRATRQGRTPILPPNSELVAGQPHHAQDTCRCRIYTWNNDVDPLTAAAGITWLVHNMHHGNNERITLPQDLLNHLTGKPAMAAA